MKLERCLSALVALAILSSCGASSTSGSNSGGNPGSETHWLAECSSDSECGNLSCYCGLCTRACDDAAQCVNPGVQIEAQCVPRGALEMECETSAPRKLCAPPDSVEMPETSTLPVDGGDATPTSITVDAGSNSSDSPDAGIDPTPFAICDGSDDLRLVAQSAGGGPTSPEQYFTTHYGSSLVIDGHCHFWVNSNGQLKEGQIEDQSVLEAYQATSYGRLARFHDFTPVSNCSDAGSTFIWDPQGSIAASTCGVTEDQAPPGWLDVFSGVSQLTADLTTFAKASAGPLRVAFDKPMASATGATPWPFDWDPLPLLPTDPQAAFGVPDILVPAGRDAESLRSVLMYGRVQFALPAGAGNATSVDLYARDELPSELASRLTHITTGTYSNPELVGQECTSSADCSRFICTAKPDGSAECGSCILPDDAEHLCHSNDDCCDGLFCCVDCGDRTGSCVLAEDPCATCVEIGGTWSAASHECVNPANCTTGCISEGCPGPCSEENCAGCLLQGECLFAECDWDSTNGQCSSASDVPAEPCAIDATDPSLPGVSIHLEADKCLFATGEGGQFRYSVTLEQAESISADAYSFNCLNPKQLSSWIEFQISGEMATYCPGCDNGPCLPVDTVDVTLDPATSSQTIDWPGLKWNGPSDTSTPPSGEFPPGQYTAWVELNLPGLGSVRAELPVEVK
jgi:hypothetical protein